jgi:hypothetical protein
MARLPFPRGGIRTRLPLTIYRRSSEFSPADISGLALWLDANTSGSLFQNSDGTSSSAAADDPVGYWKDLSGNGRHYTQGTNNNRPLLKLATHNGKNSVYFDGSVSLLGITNSSTNIVNANICDASGACAFVAYEPNSDTQYAVLKTGYSVSGYDRFNSSNYHGNFRAARFGALANPAPSSGKTILTSSSVVAADRQAFRINGSELQSQTCATTYATWRGNTSQNWSVGADAAYLAGWVCEVIILGRAATDAEIAKVEKYLASKYGITLA